MIKRMLPLLFALSLSSEATMAANCTSFPLPYNLTNGQTADAFVDVSDARMTLTRTQRGVSDRRAQEASQ